MTRYDGLNVKEIKDNNLLYVIFQIIADRLFGVGSKLDTLAQNYSLVLSNSHFTINEVRPLVPALVEVGGLHLDESQKLPRVS